MSDLEIAKQLEQNILGHDWHPLACGCLLHVVCRMPSTAFAKLSTIAWGHKYCGTHSEIILGYARGIPMPERAFEGWYQLNVDGVGAVTAEQFQTAFDVEAIDTNRKHPRILSVDRRHWIYRTGMTTAGTYMGQDAEFTPIDLAARTDKKIKGTTSLPKEIPLGTRRLDAKYLDNWLPVQIPYNSKDTQLAYELIKGREQKSQQYYDTLPLALMMDALKPSQGVQSKGEEKPVSRPEDEGKEHG